MKFANYRNQEQLEEAYNNLNDNYAIISGNLDELKYELSEYKIYKVSEIEYYKSKTLTETKASYIVINNSTNSKLFKEEMVKLAQKYNQNNIRLFENKTNYIISTNTDINAYPGFGKIGVHVELSEDLFKTPNKLNPLPQFNEDLNNGLGIIFPTEIAFN